MMYGDTAHSGNMFWLTDGVAAIPQWRYNLAMALSFPGIILYGIALFWVQNYIKNEKHKKIYHYLNAFGLTPWIGLHLFYIMILTLFSWLNHNGYAGEANTICEALYDSLSWLVPVSEILMLPVFLYWFYLQISGKTIFPKGFAFTNVLVIYGALYLVRMILPDSPFRIGFINGMMSESMLIWFGIMLFAEILKKRVHDLG